MHVSTKRRALFAALAAAGALSIAGVGAGPSPAERTAQSAGAVNVTMGDNFFAPAKAKVKVGGKVRWTNGGKVDHNVTIGSGFASGNLAPGQGVARRFKRTGKFPYSCTLHAAMRGSVKVIAP